MWPQGQTPADTMEGHRLLPSGVESGEQDGIKRAALFWVRYLTWKTRSGIELES